MIELITAGESHGKAMIATLSGVPAGIAFDEDFINAQLAQRQKGYGRGGRMKIETDEAEVIAGVREGKTTGSPIVLAVWNKDWENWKGKSTPPVLKARPAHADLCGAYKYDHLDDIRHVLERASARETAARVAGSAVARLFLKQLGIEIFSHVVNFGGIEIDTSALSFDEIRARAAKSELRCAADESTEQKIKEKIDRCIEQGDTLGGIVEVIVPRFPAMIGSYQTAEAKLDAQIARTAISVQACKGVQFGLGFGLASVSGKNAHDEISYDGTYRHESNRAGGINGGMSNGMPIVFRAVMKPIPTLMSPLSTVNIQTKEAVSAVKERSDVTAVPAFGVVMENAVCIDLANAIFTRYGSDHLSQIKKNLEADDAQKEFGWNV